MNARKMNDAYTTGIRWDAMTASERQTAVKLLMSNAMIMKGQGRMDIGTMDTIVMNIDEFIASEYPGMKDKEFEYMLNLGISGELDSKETYVSGANVMRWVRAYYRNPERLALVDAEDKKKQEDAKRGIDVAEKNVAAFNDAMRRAIEFYQENGTIFGETRDKDGRVTARGFALVGWAAQVYQHFKALGQIPAPTEEELEAVKVEATNKTLEDRVVMLLGTEFMKSSNRDWIDALLLERYIGQLTAK